MRRAEHQPTVPARDAIGVVDRAGETIAPERMLWDDVVGPGGESSHVLPRGAVVRLTDVDGDACANLLVYNAAQPLERLNVADTVKVQWQAYLGAGSLLLSDMGRVLLSIVADTSGTHDALCGASNRTPQRGEVRERFRARRPPQRAATASRWRSRSTGSGDATSCPTSTCSRA